MRASICTCTCAGFMHDKEDESKDGFCDVTDYLIGRKISNLSKEQFIKSIFGLKKKYVCTKTFYTTKKGLIICPS